MDRTKQKQTEIGFEVNWPGRIKINQMKTYGRKLGKMYGRMLYGWTETDRDGQKWTVTDRNEQKRQKEKEPDKTDRNRQKRTNTDRNGQQLRETD